MCGSALVVVVSIGACAACSTTSGNKSAVTTTFNTNIVAPNVIGRTAPTNLADAPLG